MRYISFLAFLFMAVLSCKLSFADYVREQSKTLFENVEINRTKTKKNSLKNNLNFKNRLVLQDSLSFNFFKQKKLNFASIKKDEELEKDTSYEVNFSVNEYPKSETDQFFFRWEFLIKKSDLAPILIDYFSYPDLTKKFEFNFFDKNIVLMTKKNKFPELKNTELSIKNTADFFQLCYQNPTITLWSEQLFLSANRLHLNDWGKFLLFKKAAQKVYSDEASQKLLTWYLMVICGYQFKIGYEKDNIYLIYSCKQDVYNTPFFLYKKDKFYIMDADIKSIKNITTYGCNYIETPKKIDITMEYPPLVSNSEYSQTYYNGLSKELDLFFGMGTLDLYSEYPSIDLETTLKNNISINVLSSFKKNIQEQLDAFESKKEKINFLLNFIQLSFNSKNINKNRSRILFAEEAFANPKKCSIEEKVILFCHLVKHLTGQETYILIYDSYICSAVQLSRTSVKEDGAFFEIDGLKYWICDPNQIGARAGNIKPSLLDKIPRIIKF